MKHFILAIATAAVISTAAIALAANLKPEDYRRTLFAPVGQDMLILEAPKGMCFIDPSKYTEGSMFRLMADIERKKGNGVLLGIFGSCVNIANFGTGAHVENPMSSGTIVWLNPSVGEKTPMEKADYLDMREPTWKEDVQKKLTALKDRKKDEMRDGNVSRRRQFKEIVDYVFDDQVRRTQDGVSISYSHKSGPEFDKTKTVSVAATTSLRHYPVELVLHLNADEGGYNAEDAYMLMDKLLAQQSALND